MGSASQSRSARKQPNDNLITLACEAMYSFSSVATIWWESSVVGKFGEFGKLSWLIYVLIC